MFRLYLRRWLSDRSNFKVAEKSHHIGCSSAETADRSIQASPNEWGKVSWINHLSEDSAKEFIQDKAALEDKTVTLPKNQDFLDEHKLLVKDGKGYAHVPKKAEFRDSHSTKRHGDDVIAMGLLFQSRALDGGSIENYISTCC